MEKEHLSSNQNRKLEQDKFTFFIAQKRPKKYLGTNKDQIKIKEKSKLRLCNL